MAAASTRAGYVLLLQEPGQHPPLAGLNRNKNLLLMIIITPLGMFRAALSKTFTISSSKLLNKPEKMSLM